MEPESNTNEVKSDLPGWTMLPFVEQFFVLVLMVVLLPGALGAYLLARGSLVFGLVVTAIWVLLFRSLALGLHRSKRVSLVVSVTSAVLVFLAVMAAFYVP